jgi:hypothetical protein
MRFSWRISCFSFQFCLILFAANKWLDPNKFHLEKLPCFSFAKNTPFFTLIVQRVFSFSARTLRFSLLWSRLCRCMSPQKLFLCYHLPTRGWAGVKLGDADTSQTYL